jgi:hypothetical protein
MKKSITLKANKQRKGYQGNDIKRRNNLSLNDENDRENRVVRPREEQQQIKLLLKKKVREHP